MIKKGILGVIKKMGYEVYKPNPLYNEKGYPVDLDKDFIHLYEQTKSYTMTSIERMNSAFNAVEYILKANVIGDIVECGVWRGGSSMIMALQLMRFKNSERNMFLYDTFEGMSVPIEGEKSLFGKDAMEEWKKTQTESVNEWCYAPIEDVQKNLYSTGYPKDKFHFIKGKVEDTIPENLPKAISILRLDTDWYESTYHELVHLFPLLSKNGVLIIDDYGHWEGARGAVDKYIKENNIHILLNRIDYTGRIGIKI